jgi:hypothetical protein
MIRLTREEVGERWRKLHSQEFHNVCSSLNIIKVTKSRRMRWAGYAVCTEMMRNSYKILVEKPKGKRQFERPTHQ